MQHQIPSQELGPLGPDMADAVAGCVHCGFCLAACPTYRETGEETRSPRGRILLMKEVLEGGLEAEEARPYLDSCLGCLACEPACPSGVPYRQLLQPYRRLQRQGESEQRPLWSRLRGWMVHRVLPHRWRFRLALGLSRPLASLRRLLPAALRPMMELAEHSTLPGALPPLPEVNPARGQRRTRVVVLGGCAQEVLAPEILRSAVAVLTAQGIECVVPRRATCCGALAFHDGHWDLARRLSRQHLEVLPENVDGVVSLAAGCGSAMKEYPMLWAGEDGVETARRWAAKTFDVTEILHRLGVVNPMELPEARTVAYQDACHLAQAQGIRDAPRELLEGVEGLTLVTPEAADLCCGSAGTYNLEHPEMARRLAERKVDHLIATGAHWVASGNIGCIVQLRTELARRQVDLPVFHTIEILARSHPVLPKSVL